MPAREGGLTQWLLCCRDMLEELMDDEDEMRDMNLSSRPGREEKRRVRERDRLEREMERYSMHHAWIGNVAA